MVNVLVYFLPVFSVCSLKRVCSGVLDLTLVLRMGGLTEENILLSVLKQRRLCRLHVLPFLTDDCFFFPTLHSTSSPTECRVMVLWPYVGSLLDLWSPHHVPDQHLRALSLQIHSSHLLDSETKFLGQILSLSYFCPTCKHFRMALKRLCKLKLNSCILFSFMFGHNYPNHPPILTLR